MEVGIGGWLDVLKGDKEEGIERKDHAAVSITYIVSRMLRQ